MHEPHQGRNRRLPALYVYRLLVHVAGDNLLTGLALGYADIVGLRDGVHPAQPMRIHILGLFGKHRHLLAFLLVGIIPFTSLGDQSLLGIGLLHRSGILLGCYTPCLLLTHEPYAHGQRIHHNHTTYGGNHSVTP